ncbi:S8 family serine peptidase [Shimia sp. R10_1]|uniref:S8 family peptidase n=1 Tax=Shimia sp. R10_1 TaxID=2821095 RepID=UPI001ADC87F1|nr:S8 family peptidase [Shimia sp. R10_1]MBO9474244.1 S8 family serine peptidase [Shimia sp. R10_1]
MPIPKKRVTIAFLGASVLAACGGGDGEDDSASGGAGGGNAPGGGGGPVSNLPFTDDETLLASFISNLDSLRTSANRLLRQDARYRRQTADGRYFVDRNNNGTFDDGVDVSLEGNPIEAAGIHYAHAAGLTGAGETIAFSDSGFLPGHTVFAGKDITLGRNLPVTDHGTFVASVATGNSSTMIGVAPEADAIFGSYNTFAQLSETARAARAQGAVALNNSWGFVARDAVRSDYDRVFGSSAGADYLSALTDYAEDGIVVFAISNDHEISRVGLLPGLPVFHSDLEKSWIAVINGVPELNGDDVVSATRVSGACLEAAAWCIAANGNWTGANASNGYRFGTGTSFAAPTVSGALALLAEAFPDMSHQQLRVRLLATADNEFDGFQKSGSVELVPGFEHDYSREWGHGFLDVAAALLPIGQPTITTADGRTINTREPLVVSGAASGNAIKQALEGVDVVSRDALSAGFVIDAAQMVATRDTNPLFSLNDVLNFDQIQEEGYGSIAFFGDNRLTPFATLNAKTEMLLFQSQNYGDESIGFGLARHFDLGGANLRVSATYGDDTASLLSDWNGGGDAAIFSMDMALSTDLSAKSQLRVEFGYAFGQETTGFGQASDVVMNASALTLSHRDVWARNDRLNLSVSLPAAISSGATALSLPVTNALGVVTHQTVPIDLSPDEREVRLELSYGRPLSRRTSMGVSLAHAMNRGHIAGRDETAILFGINTRF